MEDRGKLRDVFVASPGSAGVDAPAWRRLVDAFETRNPGYAISWEGAASQLPGGPCWTAGFVWRGEGRARIGAAEALATPGDLLLIPPGEELASEGPLDLLVFRLPGALPETLPAFIRPDHDPLIADTPGGCATEARAYRRILLTWMEDNGPYVYHGLNAHRVLMWDAFSHYHPYDGGFDELYLVEKVSPGGHLLVSGATEAIENAARLCAEEALGLMVRREVAVGDVVYIPRGVVHRAVGGVLAQVITVPGFKPGSEIGVDHHLRTLSERLGLADPLPFNAAASSAPLVK